MIRYGRYKKLIKFVQNAFAGNNPRFIQREGVDDNWEKAH